MAKSEPKSTEETKINKEVCPKCGSPLGEITLTKTGSSIDVPALNQRQDTQVLGATHTVVNVRWELKL